MLIAALTDLDWAAPKTETNGRRVFVGSPLRGPMLFELSPVGGFDEVSVGRVDRDREIRVGRESLRWR